MRRGCRPCQCSSRFDLLALSPCRAAPLYRPTQEPPVADSVKNRCSVNRPRRRRARTCAYPVSLQVRRPHGIMRTSGLRTGLPRLGGNGGDWAEHSETDCGQGTLHRMWNLYAVGSGSVRDRHGQGGKRDQRAPGDHRTDLRRRGGCGVPSARDLRGRRVTQIRSGRRLVSHLRPHQPSGASQPA